MTAPEAPPRFPFAVAGAAAAIATLTTLFTLGAYLPTLNTSHTAIEGVPHGPSPIPETPAMARRLAVIVLDGLSYEMARQLPDLEPLRRRGVMRSLFVEFPSFTSPAIVSFMTGLAPRDSGTRLNGNLRRVRGIDSLTRAAGEARATVTVYERGYDDFARIVVPPTGARMYPGKLAPIVDIARRALEPSAPGGRLASIDLLHWGAIDDAGHEHGARSREYRDAAMDGAAFAARYASSLDLEQDALVVLSDHGHLATGGHGGAEPEARHALFLAVGRPFHGGVELDERPMRDVASTLAIVAGLRAPTSSLGLPMMDVLSLPRREASRALAVPFDQAARFSCRVAQAPGCAQVDAMAARLGAHDPGALGAAEELYASISHHLDRELAARRAEGARRRLAITATAIALGLWAVWVALGRRERRGRDGGASRREGAVPPTWPLLAASLPFVNLLVYVAYFGGIGYRPGFTYLRAAPLLIGDALPGGLLAAALVALFAWRRRPGPAGPWMLMIGSAAPFALLAAWVGWDPTTPPPPIAGAAVFQLAPAVISAAVGAVLVAMMELRPARRVA